MLYTQHPFREANLLRTADWQTYKSKLLPVKKYSQKVKSLLRKFSEKILSQTVTRYTKRIEFEYNLFRFVRALLQRLIKAPFFETPLAYSAYFYTRFNQCSMNFFKIKET